MTTIEAKPEANAARLASAQGENLLKLVKSRYVAPQRMRKHHRDTVKMIKSLEQGHDGSIALCYFCKCLLPITKMQLHHKDHNISDNQLTNLEICDQDCNNQEHAKWRTKRQAAVNLSSPQQGEGEFPTPTSAYRQLTNLAYSSREGAKHEVMRSRFNSWIRDLENGPFAGRHSWPKLELADAAPYGCAVEVGVPFGSHKTYLGYVNVDIKGRILIEDKKEGVANVYLNRDMLKQIQEQAGQ